MSIPVNPLDKYRSHSIHYILTVASNSEAFRPYLAPSQPDGTGFLSNVTGKKLGDDIGGGVYLLVDSRKTSEFSIANVTFTTLVNASGEYAGQTLTNEGLIHVQVVDPSGVGFFNYFRYLTFDKLKTSGSGGLVFCLHITFVGHTDTGATEHVSTVGIPMIMGGEFTLSEYTTRGAVYDMGFCAQTMSIGQMPQMSEIPKVLSVKFENSLLGTAVQAIENQLNVTAREWYLKANPVSKPPDATGQPVEKKDKTERNGRIIRYMITIPPNWFYFTVCATNDRTPETIFYGDGTKAAAEEEYKRIQEHMIINKANNGVYTSQVSNDVKQILMNLLMLCPEVTQMYSEISNIDELTKPKVNQSISSSEDEIVIHFDIVTYKEPNPKAEQNKVFDGTRTGPEKNDKKPDGAIEFEYLFSGHNQDILDFNIKIDNLMVGLETSSAAPYELGKDITSQSQKKKNNLSPETQKKTFFSSMGQNQPMYLPPRTTTQRSNQTDVAPSNNPLAKEVFPNAQAFHQTLADMHFAMATASVKIRGNPNLFSNFVVEAIPPVPKITTSVKDYIENGDASYIDKLSKWEYDPKNQTTATGNGSIVQAHLEHRKFVERQLLDKKFLGETQYAKINVYGPRDYPFNQEGNVDEYKVKLFYDDWYFIQSVVHTFSGSDFTQELVLVMHPQYQAVSTKKPKEGTNNAN